jgi:two-component system NtrC family sensor kinase
MADELGGARARLERWNEDLKREVDLRTRELREAHAQLSETQKLAAIGQLGAGVAHEINNPLTGILTFSSLLRQKLPDGSQDAEDVDLVIRETKRCAGIIKRLLDFARDKPPEKKFADLNQIIEDTVRIVERQAQVRDIEIALDLDRTLPPIWADADQIKQVIMNMLINAQHAIEDKGTITVKSCRALEAKRAEPGAEPVPMVEFAVIDTGCGIPDKNLRRIFDPFFTSKAVGQGTGLGLSVSHGIVQAHGGLIEVDSKVGEGSTFRVFLPIDPPDAQAVAAPEMEAIRSS